MCTREKDTHSHRGGMMGVHSLVCVRIPGLENTDVLKSEPVHAYFIIIHVNSNAW